MKTNLIIIKIKERIKKYFERKNKNKKENMEEITVVVFKTNIRKRKKNLFEEEKEKKNPVEVIIKQQILKKEFVEKCKLHSAKDPTDINDVIFYKILLPLRIILKKKLSSICLVL